ncbi:MAG: UPF0158 family protein [Prolixibacteraceae bacterium]|jgi:hypothetical protein|nr:UPF0158 family protein [Ignavibacteriaceae bacterium]MCK9412390.1 UPF0158 family protein [Prolixibacteraceae bacterium]
MKPDQLLNQILPILHSVKEDEKKLQQILDFLLEEIYEEPDETVVIPEKHRELVRRIAENIDCGLVCFVNPDTFEMEDAPRMMVDDPHEYRSLTGVSAKDFNLHHKKWKRCITVEPPESSESFGIMESFVDEVEDKNLKKRVINALSNRRPFANFKNLIETSNYREQWFAFKQRKLEEYVWENLINENFSLNQED